ADAILAERRQRLDLANARLPRLARLIEDRRGKLALLSGRLAPALRRPLSDAQVRLTRVSGRLAPRRLRDRLDRLAERMTASADRLHPAQARLRRDRADRLAALARTLRSLGPRETLARGFAIVRDGEGRVLPRAESIGPGAALELEFADGRVAAVAGRLPATQGEPSTPRPKRRRADDKQGSLF
ncbi:MAG TPA: exodeoxyribonuclease VII large subunit, partial [Paracoccaceae bacterium]|nr:exodeoxyribonuclease VII large subunit [Paracoccaceae bacterium]